MRESGFGMSAGVRRDADGGGGWGVGYGQVWWGTWRCLMLRWAIVFFIVAIIAAIFGFGGIAGAATDIARILFFIFLVVFLVALVWGLAVGRRPPGV
jgi:uncharacterized membrane protein YtjA (UPF0391 family)